MKDSILTLSSAPVVEGDGGLGRAVGGLAEGSLEGLGLGVGEVTRGLVPGPSGLGQLRLLFGSRVQLRLLTVSVAPTL